jgi:hypothetical protein
MRGNHWMVCAIVSESADEIAVFKKGNSEDQAGGYVIFPNGNKVPKESFERADGKIQFPNGNIIDNPNPAVGKISPDFREALGKKYVLCDDGGSRREAMRDLFTNKLEGPRVGSLARPIDFNKLTLSHTKEISDTIQDQIWENKQIARYVPIKHPFHLYSLPVTFKTKSGVWHACLIVSDEMDTLDTPGLTLGVPTHTVAPGKTLQFSTTGGTPPYSYRVTSGVGSIDPNSGLYTAPTTVNSQTSVTIRVRDSASNFATDTILVE